MSRALVTFATGGHQELLDVALPAMRRYASRHGYELRTTAPDWAQLSIRPASWWKIPALQSALRDHDEALWVDADVLIVDDGRDVADELPEACWHALVAHHTPDGEVPSCGVWLVRRQMLGTLSRIWATTKYLHHGWWEQAALIQQLGYRLEPRPVTHEYRTPLYRHTHWLDLEWNSHEQMDRHPDPRFAHATCGPLDWRLGVMRRYAAQTPATTGG